MVSLDACLAALATLKTRELLELAMKLLDLPAQAARVLCRRRGILSEVVGHNPVRAVCRHLDPEQLHFVVFGKALDFNRLAGRESLSIPLAGFNMAGGRFAVGPARSCAKNPCRSRNRRTRYSRRRAARSASERYPTPAVASCARGAKIG